jgi:hypothetical protein
MLFEDCPEQLIGSAVDLDKEPIDLDTIEPDDIICIRRKQ